MKRLLLIGLVFLFACNKKPTCETWDISHECKSTSPTFICVAPISYMTVELCDEDLKDAHEGKDKEREIAPGAKEITHYIKRVK